MKYKEWLMNWLANYVMPNYKSRTCDRYTNIVMQHIIPKLGDYDLAELTPFIVQQFITDLTTHGNLKTGKGLAANTVNSISLEHAYKGKHSWFSSFNASKFCSLIGSSHFMIRFINLWYHKPPG